MPNTKKWSELRETHSKLTPEQRAENDRGACDENERIARHLADLCKARSLTRAQLAEAFSAHQASISRPEAQGELFLTTLARFVEAAGGRLRVVAEFGGSEAETIEFDVAALLREDRDERIPLTR